MRVLVRLLSRSESTRPIPSYMATGRFWLALHSLAATLVEFLAREFTEQLTVFLLFVAAGLYFFAR